MHWHYKNLTILLISFLLAYLFAQTYMYQALLTNLSTVGYAGILLIGIFFVSMFTVAPAALILVGLAQYYDNLTIAVIAGAGAMIGDVLIFRFIREGVLDELRELIGKRNVELVLHPFRSRYFAWLLPLIGAMIIASPLPDEAGVALMGVSAIRQWLFVPLAFTLNAIGIYILVSVATE